MPQRLQRLILSSERLSGRDQSPQRSSESEVRVSGSISSCRYRRTEAAATLVLYGQHREPASHFSHIPPLNPYLLYDPHSPPPPSLYLQLIPAKAGLCLSPCYTIMPALPALDSIPSGCPSATDQQKVGVAQDDPRKTGLIQF